MPLPLPDLFTARHGSTRRGAQPRGTRLCGDTRSHPSGRVSEAWFGRPTPKRDSYVFKPGESGRPPVHPAAAEVQPRLTLSFPQHPDENAPQRPVLLAVDQEFGEKVCREHVRACGQFGSSSSSVQARTVSGDMNRL